MNTDTQKNDVKNVDILSQDWWNKVTEEIIKKEDKRVFDLLTEQANGRSGIQHVGTWPNGYRVYQDLSVKPRTGNVWLDR